jgi:hypothetical protein
VSSPIDLPDWIATVGTPAPQLLGTATAAAVPFTTAAFSTAPWQTFELIVTPTNNVTANNVLTVTVTWVDGTGANVVWVDTFTMWSSQTVGVAGVPHRYAVPVRGSSVTVSLASNGANDTVTWFAFGAGRATSLRCEAAWLAASPALLSVAGVATTANQIVNYRIGPTTRRVTSQATSHAFGHTFTLFAELPIAGGITETQVGFGIAAVGTPATIADLILPQVAIRAQVQNQGGGAATFDVAILGDYA